MLSQLDWTSSLKTIDVRLHWRLLVSAALGASISCIVWFLAFPFGYWFIKFWAGAVTGGTAGMIFGTIWQLRNKGRRLVTSGWFVFLGTGGWGLLAGISIFLFAPMMRAQEAQRSTVRSFNSDQIAELWVSLEGREAHIREHEKIAAFVNFAKGAELFFPNHEGTLTPFRLTIMRRGSAPLDYEGRVPTGHPDDMALEFRAGFSLSEILIPGGWKWLEDATQQSERR